MREHNERKILIFLLLFLKHLSGQCHANGVKIRTGRIVSRLYHLQLINMLNIIDEDGDPCKDFFAHSCGFYTEAMNDQLQLTEKSGFYTAEPLVSPYLYNYQDRMNFFERNKMNFVTHSGRRLGALYTSCKHRRRIDEQLDSPLRRWHRILREIPFLGKNSRIYMEWPLLRHEWFRLESQHANLDWMSLASKLAAYGVENFVRIFFAENTIYVAPVRDKEDVYCHSYHEWQTKLSTIRKKISPQDVDIIVTELLTFCRELIQPYEHEGHPERYSRKYYNGAHINDSFIYNMSSDYFQLYFKSLQLSEEQVAAARVLHIQKNRLHATVSLLQSTHPRILFNFVLWQAYSSLQYEDCFLLTEEFEDMLLSEYWNWDVFNAHFSRKVALSTYIYHTTRFQDQRRALLMGDQWDRFLYSKLQRSDFNIQRMLSTYAKVSIDPTNLTIVYGTDKVAKGEGDFYANLLYLRQRKLRNTFFSAFIDLDDYNHPIYFLRHFLHFTILSLQRPLFHYFATLGFDIWFKSNLVYNSDGYYTALDCLERQSLSTFENSTFYKLLDETQVAEIFRFYRAYLESLRDYNFWLEGEFFAFAEDYVLEHFHLSSKRILFYAVTQLYCGRNDEWYSLLINKSFMNMPQFETAFECDAVASMNPLVKCMINHCD